ncbi:hypothetical protein [Rhodococcus xishaensis]|uniref:Rad52/22 family double-strand break repair protein n=1 Tax=Rhodococcus xishaensis TaxID=2487364 RepID=A0A438AWE3_9NOCA|nr:hypothetical protein [Rhodococcus xishaensis]RVW03027.1 hypothetical protein EGT50_09980 [Rhodococcus xishaensis]
MTNLEGLKKLREPFPDHQVNQLPKPLQKNAEKGRCRECGGWHGLPALHLDYVGHAALTDRFLEVDPEWSWEPLAIGADGLPVFDRNGGLWIRLTICGVSRLGYGDADGKSGGNAIKEAIGDALRNAGMRFGAALELWHKGDLHEAAEAQGQTLSPADEARAALLETLRSKGIDPKDAVAQFRQDHGVELRDSADVDAIKALAEQYRGQR